MGKVTVFIEKLTIVLLIYYYLLLSMWIIYPLVTPQIEKQVWFRWPQIEKQVWFKGFGFDSAQKPQMHFYFPLFLPVSMLELPSKQYPQIYVHLCQQIDRNKYAQYAMAKWSEALDGMLTDSPLALVRVLGWVHREPQVTEHFPVTWSPLESRLNWTLLGRLPG